MESFNKIFTKKEHGFNGSCEAYLVDANKENLQNFLKGNGDGDGNVYNSIKQHTNQVLVVKNLNVDKKYQGQGCGSYILSELINESYADAVVLLSDTLESQKRGFILEKFYESNGFVTVKNYHDYPLMVYPQEIAEKILFDLDSKKTLKNKI